MFPGDFFQFCIILMQLSLRTNIMGSNMFDKVKSLEANYMNDVNMILSGYKDDMKSLYEKKYQIIRDQRDRQKAKLEVHLKPKKQVDNSYEMFKSYEEKLWGKKKSLSEDN